LVKSFASWYNGEHLHSAIRFVTPNARHAGQDRATLANRASLYASARSQNPERWSGQTRNWQPAGPVWLNPETEISASEIRDVARNRRTTYLTNTELKIGYFFYRRRSVEKSSSLHTAPLEINALASALIVSFLISTQWNGNSSKEYRDVNRAGS